ncbi:Small-conductance mechanosensitive channel [Dyadobacter sp. CECT 9623]|jgi:small conductance mechanosensitive channel|uniref:Small-conductance mechanosensitive channel n=1 Tax=Dyadobacter linearis TaxID=2823330 RepID=A0ABM8UPB9_9BACT|nr:MULTISPECIES: mechanosensitive ion channel family protein [unclassified Dyadobacter]MCE7060603.1 mechanosensitive ion channel family protein [Dyadobacter sp. CY343]CAG5069349.1 Small-conductance mechanosensitive channel [Dyadobacter sp. CECT 9623]
MKLQQFYNQVYAWLLRTGPSFLLGIGVLIVGFWLIRILSRWLTNHLYKRKIDPSLTPFLLSLSITTLRVLLIISVMQIIGIQMTVFAAIIGAIGVAAGLALSGTLQNFTSGILILLLKPFEVGDNILAQGQEGTVTAIKIFYTIVQTFDNRTVVIPNSKLSNEVIINISRSGTRRLDVEMKFSNSIDYQTVKSTIENVLDGAQNALKIPERRIGISSIEADGYKVMVNVWLDAHGFIDTKMEIQEKMMEALRGSGLKLPGLG